MPKTALPAARAQLVYWQHARALAFEIEDGLRIARCDQFIDQLEHIISALEHAAEHIPQSE